MQQSNALAISTDLHLLFWESLDTRVKKQQAVVPVYMRASSHWSYSSPSRYS